MRATIRSRRGPHVEGVVLVRHEFRTRKGFTTVLGKGEWSELLIRRTTWLIGTIGHTTTFDIRAW